MGGWRCGQQVQVMAVPQDPKGSDPGATCGRRRKDRTVERRCIHAERPPLTEQPEEGRTMGSIRAARLSAHGW
jgi:hypothetical protein